MKILMLIDELNIGGAETHVEALAKELDLKGHKIILASAGGIIQNKLLKSGIKCFSLPLIFPNARNSAKKEHKSPPAPLLCRFLAARDVIIRIIKNEDPDIVHAHTRRTAFLAHRICKKSHIPLVVTAHAKFSMQFPKNLLSKWGDRTIAVSKDIKNHLIYHNVSAEKIEVIVNGIILPSKNQNTRQPTAGEEAICEK